ncbi:MAG: alkaline phosphatase [Gemmatimonadota bacterium]|nr:alkaline phosphatase [Gemmatimonadota bacterium]
MTRLAWTLMLLILASCAGFSGESDVPGRPPNVVLLVGDGFGVGAWSLGRAVAEARGESLAFSTAETVGFLDTRPAGARVTDSAAAATAWSLGMLAPVYSIGIPAGEDSSEVLFETLGRAGRACGFVTTARVTHATPGPFYARVDHRGRENDMAAQLVKAGFTVALGGGARHFRGEEAGGRRQDQRDLIAEARVAGVAVVEDLHEALPTDRPVLGLLADSHLPHSLDSSEADPDLAEMCVAAIERLRASGTPWFLLAEEAHVDIACHEHDGAGVAANVLRLDRALRAVLGTVDLDSTLVLVVADHATDSPTLMEYAAPESLSVVTMSVARMEAEIFGGESWEGTPAALEAAALPVIDRGARHTGLRAADLDRLITGESHYDRKTALGGILSGRFGISFIPYEDHLRSTRVHGHTGEPVPVRAWGVRAGEARGIRTHDLFGQWLRDVLGVAWPRARTSIDTEHSPG